MVNRGIPIDIALAAGDRGKSKIADSRTAVTLDSYNARLATFYRESSQSICATDSVHDKRIVSRNWVEDDEVL
jgi:hypothetical protein